MPQLGFLERLSSYVISSHLVILIEAFQDGNLSMLALIKLLLVSCLLMHHGPKWVTCPRQESVLEGLHKGLDTRKYNSFGTITTIFYYRCPSVHIDFSTWKLYWASFKTPRSHPMMASIGISQSCNLFQVQMW